MKSYLRTLENEFRRHGNNVVAKGQKAYMKGQFEFIGLKTPVRRKLQGPFLAKAALPERYKIPEMVELLWNMPEREFQLFAQELVQKYFSKPEKADIDLLEYMMVNKSWWDTVDFIAVKLVANYFWEYPAQIKPYVDKWLASDNIWLQRCALLFQLNYKEKLDTELLQEVIHKLLGSKEFFINKAIGWILRQYSKTNPDWVRQFVDNTELAALSRKEALRKVDK
ncbi:DNA alkylation repair protein [Echinicola strongylocentroti]|uniref:DNA alkylation repair protein n=1 Tax=Echinicola strongylocentroti TaxID=1795355 RepID=A0A2Z4IJ50_9BACT|nr:DNA alkylation repair protein [Echinicola strongylocentroti]AWW30720.1 DNA alkylation repair protein [Echinicola strongylocentroti]